MVNLKEMWNREIIEELKIEKLKALINEKLENWYEEKHLSEKDIKEISESKTIQQRLNCFMIQGNQDTFDKTLFLSLSLKLTFCPVLIEAELPVVSTDNGERNLVKVAVFIDGKWQDLRRDLYKWVVSLGNLPSKRNYRKKFNCLVGSEDLYEKWLKSNFYVSEKKIFTLKNAQEVLFENREWSRKRMEKMASDNPDSEVA